MTNLVVSCYIVTSPINVETEISQD